MVHLLRNGGNACALINRNHRRYLEEELNRRRSLLRSAVSSFATSPQITSSSNQIDVVESPSTDTDPATPKRENFAPQEARERVVVAMSGGVDSSVAAYLLQTRISQNNDKSSPHRHHRVTSTYDGGDNDNVAPNSGVDIIGLHMSNWNALDEDPDEPPKQTSIIGRRRRRGHVTEKDASIYTRKSIPEKSLSQPFDGNRTFCQTSENEYNDAKAVAQHLDLPLHRVSFASEYWIQVFEPFIESLSSSSSSSPTSSLSEKEGEDSYNNYHNEQLTMPNPDFGCNTYIKFGAMKDYAMNTLHADYVATGHYAQIWHRDYLTTTAHNRPTRNYESAFHQWMLETSQSLEQQVMDSIAGRPEEDWILSNNCTHYQSLSPSLPMLLAGADRSKDQTYFLSGVKGEALRNVIFPLGHLAKQRQSSAPVNNDCSNHRQTVRDIALQANIPTALKRDSMGICFIGKRNFGQFVSQYLPEIPQPGNFVDIDTGEIVGTHDGAVRYTLGEGARISGAKVRYFVCGKGAQHVDEANTVFVCNSTHHPSLFADELYVDFDSFNWIGLGRRDFLSGEYSHVPYPLVNGNSITLLARLRHLQPLTTCTVTWKNRSDKKLGDKGHLVVQFDKAMRAITPGQIVTLYAGLDGLICLGGGIIKMHGASYMDRGMDVTPALLHPSGCNDLSV